MPGRSDFSASIPSSPPPPQNLSSYSRFMHAHTKRQMEASGSNSSSGSSSPPRSSNSTARLPSSSILSNGNSTSPTHYQ
ncbi:hypothetical protein FZEAL_5717 [Fusarium zealandicum]|uniref:Uncharacterized protein n=1 Tax=Fusarium zealandicum TaxID=1053134 RepID=A0A8H4UJ50_9HYPO|nr:hypothetical protein FZEAL_5717 [Fusarium zealandicum]